MKIKHIILFAALLGVGISCKDDSLDPLQFANIKKGTELALRGDALQSLYHNGTPIAVVAPGVADGTETFAYDAEYLAEKTDNLESVDIYVVKGSGSNTSRVLLTNVPFSQFKNDGTYPRPWVSISLKFVDMVAKLGLDNTIPLPQATVDELLSTYKFGINIESDLNLKDGSKVLAADIIASGLFQSDQFYPAMKLNYPMLNYCAYDPSYWTGAWTGVENPGSTDANNITADGAVANRFHMDNWWGDGVDAYFDMSVSTNPFDQTVTIPSQTTSEGGVASGSGTYDQCTGVLTLNCTYVAFGSTYKFIYTFTKG